MNEYYGRKCIKVGEIEAKVGYKMRVTRQALDGPDYLVNKLAAECIEGESIVGIMENE